MVEEKIKNRLSQLLEMGEVVLSTKYSLHSGLVMVRDTHFYEWKAGSLSFLSMVFGESSIHFKGFEEACQSATYLDAIQGQSILKAAKTDIDGGYLKRLGTLVAADIFADFIEMAEYLVEQGFKDPAASLIGAVLEDGLRKIAKNNEITIKSREDTGSLNNKLADKAIYNQIIRKRINVWNDIRNNADHGKFSEYTLDLVKEMIAGVRDFLAQYI